MILATFCRTYSESATFLHFRSALSKHWDVVE